MVSYTAPSKIALVSLILLLPVALVPGAAADDSYELSVWIVWDTTELDVLVTGVDDPVINAVIMDAIQAWETGIQELAPSWLKESLTLRVYNPSMDPVPPAGFEPHDIEITVVPQGFYAISHGSLTGEPQCTANAPLAHEYPTGGTTALYRVAAHEFGHCLGLDHVFQHRVEYSPSFDIMGGGRAPRACPSNLNVQVLELAFGGIFGLPSGGEVSIASGDYYQSAC